MEEQIEVQSTVVQGTVTDQIVVAVLSAIAGLMAGKLVEKGYYTSKARFQVRTKSHLKAVH
jgi:hypothetical protein